VTPSGSFNYYQNFMGDMTLNGKLTLGDGMVRYGFPVLGDKTFTFDPQSFVQFNGNIMNPAFDIKATDKIRGSVVNASGNSQLVNFLVQLLASGTLSAPKVSFDLSTDDDLSLQNELSSMSPDQRSMQAMNLLITGRYQGAGMKSSSTNLVTGSLYGFLTSTLNSWAAQNIRGVDLSFGVDQYDKSVNGEKSSATSYSYQVSKSLFNNRFKIVVGGNYTTDATVDESFAENLFSDVSFEYTLKQTNNLTMLLKLYRHLGYESILEGEVTETGLGFVMRRRLSTLRNLFKVRWGKRKPRVEAVEVRDSTSVRSERDSVTKTDDK
ncbi:MAG: translocation/assembly module TamB, partial [Muribaculaceae bacterium]|nr:translocation/assembly module TamB [Muribaculaceae bacterium]